MFKFFKNKQKIEENISSTSIHFEESAAAVQEISSSMQDVADRINLAAKSAEDNRITFSEFQNEVELIKNAIKTLNQKTEVINLVTSTISDIVSQTNLLSLNAAIEATHAGEAGKGFAVVANEVRRLAEQSRHSNVQIQQTLQDVQNVIKTVNEDIQKIYQATQELVIGNEKRIENIKELNASIQEVTAATEQLASSMSNL